jgi:flagellar biosynthesis/type III secretory pathway protein FliH
MGAEAQNEIVGRLIRIPADSVPDFIASQARNIKDQAEAEAALSARHAELEEARHAAVELLLEIDQKIEREAEELADRTARKVREKEDAAATAAALAQVSAIAADYRNLEGWLTDLIMAGVSAVIETMQPDERWSRAISRVLQDMAERRQLTLLCHPSDHSDLMKVVADSGFSDAISDVQRDPTVEAGRCYLKGRCNQVEIDLGAQVSSLRDALQESLAAVSSEGAPQ